MTFRLGGESRSTGLLVSFQLIVGLDAHRFLVVIAADRSLAAFENKAALGLRL